MPPTQLELERLLSLLAVISSDPEAHQCSASTYLERMQKARDLQFTYDYYDTPPTFVTYTTDNSRNIASAKPRRRSRGKKSKRRRAIAAAKESNTVKSSSKVTKKISDSNKRVDTSLSRKMRLAISNTAQQAQAAGQTNTTLNEQTLVTTKEQPAAIANGQSSQSAPSVSSMLYELATQFRSDIISLHNLFINQLRNDSPKTIRKQPILAEIKLKNGSPITSEAYQYMRYVILCAVDQMSLKNGSIPIYHSMTYNNTYVNILCEDLHAYKCLETCMGQMRTVGNVELYLLAPSASRLFCCSAIYKGVIADPKKFLFQIYMHVMKLRTDRWIIANSEVVENETHFLFLMDELCAQLLEHKYANRLFINLNEITFHNHGQLPNFL